MDSQGVPREAADDQPSCAIRVGEGRAWPGTAAAHEGADGAPSHGAWVVGVVGAVDVSAQGAGAQVSQRRGGVRGREGGDQLVVAVVVAVHALEGDVPTGDPSEVATGVHVDLDDLRWRAQVQGNQIAISESSERLDHVRGRSCNSRR